jgi:hypothetical protein
MAERLQSCALVTHDRLPRDRKLRNIVILANAMAWIAIIILIDLLLV